MVQYIMVIFWHITCIRHITEVQTDGEKSSNITILQQCHQHQKKLFCIFVPAESSSLGWTACQICQIWHLEQMKVESLGNKTLSIFILKVDILRHLCCSNHSDNLVLDSFEGSQFKSSQFISNISLLSSVLKRLKWRKKEAGNGWFLEIKTEKHQPRPQRTIHFRSTEDGWKGPKIEFTTLPLTHLK